MTRHHLAPEHWLYAKLFLPKQLRPGQQSRAADELLLSDLAGLFASLASAGRTWFFIRYIEHGYHLRLRIHEPIPEARIDLQKELSEALSASMLRGLRLDYAVYEPELDKYCGRHGNFHVEKHFCASSEAALRVLADDAIALPERGLILLADTLAAAAFDPARSIDWCGAYYDYWWRQFGAADACRNQDEALFERSQSAIADKLERHVSMRAPSRPRDVWRRQWAETLRHTLSALHAEEDAGRLVDPMRERDSTQRSFAHPMTGFSILPNLWHMLCNRIGISIRQEMRLAYCLMRHLSRWHAIQPTPTIMSLIPDPA